MKKENKIIVCLLMTSALLLSGCQKTPEKSSVVSKADGLSEELIADPLEAGEKRTIDMPEHWSALEKKSNDRVTLSADLDLGKLETGNLPVVEMANHTMTQKELKKLVEYFAGDEELYVPEADTKEVFQKVKDRVNNKEGAYANPSRIPFSDLISALDGAIESAPEVLPKEQTAVLEFHKKSEDVVQMARDSWRKNLGIEDEQTPDAEAFFSADVGKDRLSHIQAECYSPDLANSSSFVWKTGSSGYSFKRIQSSVRMNEFNTGAAEFQEKYRELLNQYQETLEQQPFSLEDGQKQAEQLMKKLDISEVKLLSSDKILWFPEEAAPDMRYGDSEDFYWQADLENAKVGYKYVFTRGFGGISADQSLGSAMQETVDTYTEPFPTEEVSIIVTDDGVKYFSWTGMCEEESVIAENVKLLPFDDIQKPLFEQIYYRYLKMGQPAEDTSQFTYTVTSARLGYTYVTAFQNPRNAWLVPTWFFEVLEGYGAGDDVKNLSSFYVSINAMDGGVIIRSHY